MQSITAENLPDIKRVKIDPVKMSQFKHEDDFTGLAVDLMVETTSHVSIAACTMGEKPVWDRDRAAICGNMVRLYKLLHSVLDQTCQRRQETSFILIRLVLKTLVNIRYMITNFSPELIDSYVSYSLRHERKLRDLIEENIGGRGGAILPIEERMLKSINRAATASQIDLNAVNLKDKSPWGGKNLFDKAEAVGLGDTYLATVGGPSHSVHGNWHEIYSNHLNWDENGGFTPNLDWHRPRPQVLFPLCILVIDTLGIYFSFMCVQQAVELFEAPLSDLRERVYLVNDAHEEYLSKKQWPKV